MAINFTTLATSALGFTIALAWNHAISETFHSMYPPMEANLLYAVVVTILVVIFVAVLNHTHKAVYAHNCKAAPEGKEGYVLPPIVQLWAPPTE